MRAAVSRRRGFVGTTLGKYDVFLGGDTEGTRLNELYVRNVKLEEIPGAPRTALGVRGHAAPGEGFGDWWLARVSMPSPNAMRWRR